MRHGSGTKSSKIIRSVAAPLVFITLTEVRKWKEFCQEVEGEFKERKNEPKTKTSEDSYLTVIVEHDKHVFFSILIRFYGWYYGMIELPIAAEIWSKKTPTSGGLWLVKVR